VYHLTILQDSREQTPLVFPDHIKVHLRRSKTPTLIKITTEVDTLPAGDYTIKGFDNVVLVETKRSARELRDNLLTADYQRASHAFERLQSAKHPFLVCEFGQSELLSEADFGGQAVADALAFIVAEHGLSLWFAGPRSGALVRRRTAECVLRLMIACVELEYPNFLHGVPDDGIEGLAGVQRGKRQRRTRTVCKRSRS
jgi:hypothetical protein